MVVISMVNSFYKDGQSLKVIMFGGHDMKTISLAKIAEIGAIVVLAAWLVSNFGI